MPFGLPPHAGKPDMAGDRLLPAPVIGQHAPADAEGLRGGVQGEAVAVHPFPDTLVRNPPALLHRLGPQVVAGHVQLSRYPVHRPPPFARAGLGEQLRVLQRGKGRNALDDRGEIDVHGRAVAEGKAQAIRLFGLHGLHGHYAEVILFLHGGTP